jgi:hypothetical protein
MVQYNSILTLTQVQVSIFSICWPVIIIFGLFVPKIPEAQQIIQLWHSWQGFAIFITKNISAKFQVNPCILWCVGCSSLLFFRMQSILTKCPMSDLKTDLLQFIWNPQHETWHIVRGRCFAWSLSMFTPKCSVIINQIW